jgi:SH3-like domain-containing protein
VRLAAAARLGVAVACLLAPAAWAQSVTAVPLPPPGVTRAPAAPPPGKKPVLHPAPRRVPVVKPAHVPVKKPAPPHRAPSKPPAKPAPKVATAPPAPPPAKIDPTKGTTTGLPLPRWAAFRSDDVNLRSGPGMQYPIDWVYHRRDLPVQILREFEVWRLVQEQDGTKGWVHEATLTGRRGYVVQGGEQVLRDGPQDTAGAVARLESGVVGLIDRCPAGSDWCAVRAGGYHGWLKREAVYGVSATEVIP